MIRHTTLQVGGRASVFLFWENYAANDVDVPHGRVSAGRCHASEKLHKNLGLGHRRLVVTVRLRPAGYAGHASLSAPAWLRRLGATVRLRPAGYAAHASL